jgi:hypothetical protein
MQNIEKNVSDNIGGIYTFYFIPLADVVSIPLAVNKLIGDAIVLDTDKYFFTAQITRESFSYKEPQTDNEDGSSYAISLGGFVAGDSSQLSEQFEEMSGGRFLVLCEDNNNKKRVLGTLTNGMRFKADFDTNNKTSGLKGWNILFSGLMSERPPFYQSSFSYYPTSNPVAEYDDSDQQAQIDALEAALAEETADRVAADATKEPSITAGNTAQYWRGDKTWRDFFTDVRAATLTGLSTATNAVVTAANTFLQAIGLLQKQITDHKNDTANPHSVTKSQVGLGNVDNISDVNKPVSTAQASADAVVLSTAESYSDGLITAIKSGVPSGGDTLNKLYNLIVGIGTFVGAHDASGGAVPTTGSGPSSAIEKGDYWRISVAGTISGLGTLRAGDVIYAKSAGASAASDFFAVENNEDQATSSTLGLIKLYADLLASNTDGSPTQAAIVTALALKLAASNNLSDLASIATARANLGVDKRTAHGDSNYTILSTDKEIVTSAALTAARTWTLPAASSVNAGYELIVCDEFGGVTSTNTLILARAGSDTINGATSETISIAYGSRTLYSDGVSKWTFDAGIVRQTDSRLTDSRPQLLLAKNYTPASGTNTTSEELLHSLQVAAGKVSVNDILEIFSVCVNNSNANNKTFRIYINSSNTLSGATLLGTNIMTTNQNLEFFRPCAVLSDTTLRLFATASGSQASPFNGSTTNQATTATVPSLSAGFYILISGQKASGTDTDTVDFSYIKSSRS